MQSHFIMNHWRHASYVDVRGRVTGIAVCAPLARMAASNVDLNTVDLYALPQWPLKKFAFVGTIEGFRFKENDIWRGGPGSGWLAFADMYPEYLFVTDHQHSVMYVADSVSRKVLHEHVILKPRGVASRRDLVAVASDAAVIVCACSASGSLTQTRVIELETRGGFALGLRFSHDGCILMLARTSVLTSIRTKDWKVAKHFVGEGSMDVLQLEDGWWFVAGNSDSDHATLMLEHVFAAARVPGVGIAVSQVLGRRVHVFTNAQIRALDCMRKLWMAAVARSILK